METKNRMYKDTIRTYEELGQIYLQQAENTVVEAVFNFVELLPPRAIILDVGCAGGVYAKIFNRYDFDVVGIDLVKKFLTAAKKNAPKTQFLKMDLLDLSFAAGAFHGIWANAILLHLEKQDLPKALDNFHLVLKPGGKVYISIKEGIGSKMVREKKSSGKQRFYSFYQIDEIKECIQKANFKIDSIFYNSDAWTRSGTKWINIIAKK